MRTSDNPVGVGSPINTSDPQIMSLEGVFKEPIPSPHLTNIDVHLIVIETEGNLCRGDREGIRIIIEQSLREDFKHCKMNICTIICTTTLQIKKICQ